MYSVVTDSLDLLFINIQWISTDSYLRTHELLKVSGDMVEMMTPNQINDPGITFEWKGVKKIWIQSWIPRSLPEICIFWIFDILNILYSYYWKTVKFRCFCMGKYLIELLSTQTIYQNSDLRMKTMILLLRFLVDQIFELNIFLYSYAHIKIIR